MVTEAALSGLKMFCRGGNGCCGKEETRLLHVEDLVNCLSLMIVNDQSQVGKRKWQEVFKVM